MTTDARILTVLRATPGGVSGPELADRVGVSAATLQDRIAKLRTLGYGVEASPHRGYRLVWVPDALHADDLRSRLGAMRVVGRDIQVFEETTSTNDVAEKLARDGVEEGVVVFAEAQTRGRGRLGRRWISPRGRGLWFSVLLRPRLRPQAITQLTVAAANAIARALRRQTALLIEVKWPNDLLVNGRKVAGILTEMKSELDSVHYAILGVGVDVNLLATDWPPDLRGRVTSLRIETGGPLDRAALASQVLRELDADYARIADGRFEEVAEEWEQLCTTLGRHVAVRAGDRRIEGRAEALDADGALLLRTQHGHLERVLGGELIIQT